MRKLILALVFAMFGTVHAFAGGTPNEAKDLATKAAKFLEANGPEKAFAAFTGKESSWIDRDLYVFVYDRQGRSVAHGANPALVGKDLIDLKDPDGKAFVREFVAVKQPGWVDYKWRSPTSGSVDQKTSYIVPVGQYLVGVGAYKN